MRSHRVTLVEYGQHRLLSEFVTANKVSAALLLARADHRIRSTLRLRQTALDIDGDYVRARDFAGLLRLAPDLELEVAPKFVDPKRSDWRKDFLFLAELSRHGRILPIERLTASSGDNDSLASLTAQAMVAMYIQNQRRPLRAYRLAHEYSFQIEGDVDPVDLAFPPSEGFPQQVVRYDRRTSHNSEILAALQLLRGEVNHPRVVGPMRKVIEHLSPQARPRRRQVPVPSRSRAWEPTVELARDVLDDFGAGFDHGTLNAPGYIVSTWRVWEDAISLSCQLAFQRDWNVSTQKSAELGKSASWRGGVWHSERKDRVRPDVQLQRNNQTILIDAKYKQAANGSLADADVYEALAFMEATGSPSTVLVYPSDDLPNLGDVAPFRKIEIGAKTVFGLKIQVSGIARRGGLRTFAAGLRNGVELLIPAAN